MKTEKVIVDGVEHEVVALKAQDEDNDPRAVMIEKLIDKIAELTKRLDDIESIVRYHESWIKSEIELRNFRDERNLSMYDLD